MCKLHEERSDCAMKIRQTSPNVFILIMCCNDNSYIDEAEENIPSYIGSYIGLRKLLKLNVVISALLDLMWLLEHSLKTYTCGSSLI